MIKKTIILIALALLAFAGYSLSQWDSYHDFRDRCLDCHITVPEENEKPVAFKKDISAMCLDCHADEKQLSHPVDVKPKMSVPAVFPLDWKGEVTCATCHPVHDDGFGTSHLRSKASGPGFCTMCHSDLEKEMHKASIGTAHVSETTGARFEINELGNALDDLSIKCMSCHDAATAGDAIVDNKMVKGLFHNSNDIGVSHPIGVSYIETRMKYKGAYRPINELPPQMKLFGGLVGCGTCHNPYSKQHSELVMSNEKSALCLACHVK
ncbi:MAG: cytochrome c3 family protein [Deltaproteobacteria bacterium]|nr:cytochrome c3 family protein [Deltaproteobacteria bacterium]